MSVLKNLTCLHDLLEMTKYYNPHCYFVIMQNLINLT